MMAVILAGGKGTRLRPLTFSIPKPLLPLGDKPILEIVIRQLSAAGFDRIVLTLGHMADYFPSILGNGDKWNVELEYCVEESPLGTAGALRLVQRLEDNFLVMNGDILTSLNFDNLVRSHVKRGSWATIAVTRRTVCVDFGVVTAHQDGALEDYLEKPEISYQVSTGINVLSRRCLDLIPQTGRFDMPDLMKAIKRCGAEVYCYEFTDYWLDVGRPEDYQKACDDFACNPDNFLDRDGDPLSCV